MGYDANGELGLTPVFGGGRGPPICFLCERGGGGGGGGFHLYFQVTLLKTLQDGHLWRINPAVIFMQVGDDDSVLGCNAN